MLKPKLKECKTCGKMSKIWSRGNCLSCSKPGFKQLEGQSKLSTKRKGKSEKVKHFYAELTEKLTSGAYSAESGISIPNPTAVNMAHILPKESFPKLAIEVNNIIILTWEEHTRFDELLNRHDFKALEVDFPNAWPKVLEKLKILLPQVEEGKNLSFELEKYING